VKNQLTQLLHISCIFVLIGFFSPLYSAQITVSLPNNAVANADYRIGDSNKPAVFLLHGFMATHNLNIIQIMAEELESQGYTIIAPTLSLNINNRHSGANCDAVHTHTMQSDVDEIAWWVNWIKKKGHKKIIMVGFSTGSLQIAIFLAQNSPAIIKKAVLISPAYLAGDPFPKAEEKADIDTAKKLLANDVNQLHEYHLSYCKGDFVAPPNVFLSYKKWTEMQMINVVKNITTPYSVIIGGADHRFGTRLVKHIGLKNSKVITIPGANHFFDSPYEFDFLDQLILELVLRK